MKKIFSLLLTLTMVLSLAACGGNSSTPSTPSEDGTQSDAANSDTIKIGYVSDLTGATALWGTAGQYGAELAIKQVNENGGVLGKKVELVLEDSKGEPKEAVELAKKMGDDESIVGVLGPMTSSEAIACAPVFEEYTMVELSPCASNNQYAPMSDYAFTVAGKMEAEQPYLVERGAYEYLNAKSIGVIWVNDDWGASAFESTKEGCEEYGIEITDDESFVSGEKDFTAILTKIRQTNPEYLMLVTQAADGALILKQLEAMGWDIPVIGAGAMYSDQVILLAGEAAEGLVISAGFFLSEEDEIAWDYATKFYEGAGFYPTTHGPLSYDAALLLCAAIEKAGTTDRQAVRDALAGITDADVQALWGDVLLAGPYEFTEDEDIIRAYCLLKIVDGKWTKVSDYSKCSKFE